MSKLDLSKIMTCKDTNVPSTYSGHRSNSKGHNYDKNNVGINKQDTTTDSHFKLSIYSKNKFD